MDADDLIGELDGVLNAALMLVQVVEEHSGQLTEDQRYQMTFHTLAFFAWSHKADVDIVGEYVAIVNESLTYKGFVSHDENSTFAEKAEKISKDLLRGMYFDT